MRHFSSYGPIDKDLYYYAPRKELIEKAYTQLMGTNPRKGGHYITVWAPRQCGKTWTMQQVLFRLRKDSRFDVVKINLEHLKEENNVGQIIDTITKEIGEELNKNFTDTTTKTQFQKIFKKVHWINPLFSSSTNSTPSATTP
jgi:Cdc6-like AAA superfamily ATPase